MKREGCIVITQGPVPIVVWHNDGDPRAVDNRCPHMGFPLHKGTIDDGILTCHWHHARFDLKSGCTFDLFADDADAYPVTVENGDVYVHTDGARRDPIEKGKRRLKEGMEQNLRLVMGKAVVTLLNAGADPDEIVSQGGLYGVRHRGSGWASGLTILSAMANVTDHLDGDERIAPLYQGLVHVARDCANQPPKIDLSPLETQDADVATLKRWFRTFVEVRDVDGAKRCVLTAVQIGATDAELADLIGAAATDHIYLDTGHVVDFINKAFEMLDRVGWEHALEVLQSLIQQLCTAQRGAELNVWRHPVDLVPLVADTEAQLPALLEEGAGKSWSPPSDFYDVLLGDDPHQTLAALSQALRDGATPELLARSVTYAAALRVTRFHIQNEFFDWIGVLHTLSFNSAVHQLIKRAPTVDLLRGVIHGAMRTYLDRFLNIPPARLPASSKASGNGEVSDFDSRFLDPLDNQAQTDEAGARVYTYLNNGGDPGALFKVLAESLLREDAEFHSFQMLEVAIRQFHELEDDEQKRLVMVAAARYLAAHAPTQREMLQTLRIALRLYRGEPVYEEEDQPEEQPAAVD